MATGSYSNQSHLYTGIYTGAEIKEGVQQLIYQLVPEDTPGLVMFARGVATNVKHEWMIRRRGTRTGVAGQHRAVEPGDQFNIQTIQSTDNDEFENLAVPSRVANYCEIFRVLPRVDETTLAVNMHGVSDIMADQVEFRAQDFAIYIEERLWNGTAATGPASLGATTAWQLGGLSSSISTNSSDLAGVTIVDNNIQKTFNDCWTYGGRPQDLFCGARVKSQLVSSLGSNMTKYVDQNDRGIVNTISYYEGATQTITVHLTRDLEDSDVSTGTTAVENRMLFLDRSQIRVCWLRPPFIERLPRMAGDERVRIEGQCTLEYGDERAHGEITDQFIAAAL